MRLTLLRVVRNIFRSMAVPRPGILIVTTMLFLSACTRSGEGLSLKAVTSADMRTYVANHKGREAVVVNFWATWCAPCVEEFPMILELSHTWQNEGLQVYFVSVDWLDQIEQVRTFLEQQGVTGISFIKDQKDQPFIDGIAKAWTGAVPFTIVYSKLTGKVVDYWEGKAPREKFEAAIKLALID